MVSVSSITSNSCQVSTNESLYFVPDLKTANEEKGALKLARQKLIEFGVNIFIRDTLQRTSVKSVEKSVELEARRNKNNFFCYICYLLCTKIFENQITDNPFCIQLFKTLIIQTFNFLTKKKF